MTSAPLASRSTATIFETGQATMLPIAIRPVDPADRIYGPAFTVVCAPGHNIWVHRAVYAASPGDVLVVSVLDGFEFGYWGDILSHAARERGLAGLVIDGCVRDSREIIELGFPVFSRGLCVRGTGKDDSTGALGTPVRIGASIISPGDIIVADVDGVVAISADRLVVAESRARERDEAEAQIIEKLAGGETTLSIYGFGES